MRLGAPIFAVYTSPDEWIAALRNEGYRAAYCPVEPDADDAEVRAYSRAAAAADIVIGEVGAWSNTLSSDRRTRRDAIELCRRSLDLADRIGARCCVNIAGYRDEAADRTSPLNRTRETFDMIVETVRGIIDAVQPSRTFFVLEPMPWLYPDSADSYLELIAAVDRTSFACHFDPVNIISSPQRFFGADDLIRDFVAKLGPMIKSVHAKDVVLQDELTVHIDEVRPGAGRLDYAAFLSAIDGLDPDTPLLLEHLDMAGEYAAAADYVRAVADNQGIAV